jgi:hypothetical protein
MNFEEFKTTLHTADKGIAEAIESEEGRTRWFAAWVLGLSEIEEFYTNNAPDEAGDVLWYCAALHRFFEELLQFHWATLDYEQYLQEWGDKEAVPETVDLVMSIFIFQGWAKKLIRDKRWEDKDFVMQGAIYLSDVTTECVAYLQYYGNWAYDSFELTAAYAAVTDKLNKRFGSNGFSIAASVNRKN